MPTRNIVLTEQQSKLIDSLIESGRYHDASEVLREGLRLVEAREVDLTAKRQALKQAVRVGETAFDRGEHVDFDDPAELKAHLDRLADRALRRKKAG